MFRRPLFLVQMGIYQHLCYSHLGCFSAFSAAILYLSSYGQTFYASRIKILPSSKLFGIPCMRLVQEMQSCMTIDNMTLFRVQLQFFTKNNIIQDYATKSSIT